MNQKNNVNFEARAKKVHNGIDRTHAAKVLTHSVETIA